VCKNVDEIDTNKQTPGMKKGKGKDVVKKIRVIITKPIFLVQSFSKFG